MGFFKITQDETMMRMRWLMTAVIVFSILNTLAGQPETFWHNPAMAMRGDGLSINNPTNHTFEFFLGSGWLPFTGASLVYLLSAFLLVSVLPRRLALVTILTIIFGHYYGASNWLAVRWHLGIEGAFFYGLAVAAGIAIAAYPAIGDNTALKKLRWIMLFAMLADACVTLWGQPTAYWHNTAMVDEGNTLSRFLLMKGWYTYLLGQAVICFAFNRLVSVLPNLWGIIIALCFTLAGFTGTSNWFFYRWIMGMEAPVIFGSVLSVAIVFAMFPAGKKTKKTTVQAGEFQAKPGRLCSLC